MPIPSVALTVLGSIATCWILPHGWYHAIYRYGKLTFGLTAEGIGVYSLTMRSTAIGSMITYMVWRDGVMRLVAWGQWTDTWTPYVGILMIAGGQFVNGCVYKALGLGGVYYGYEIGTKNGMVPQRVTCFPYNLGIQHPLYISNIATVLGLGLFYGYGKIALEIWTITCISTCSYLFSIWSESGKSFCDTKKRV